MSKIDILPGKLRGIVTVPGSKSAAHRAIICAGLARGKTLIENVDLCDDIIATLGGISALGAKAEKKGNNIVITGIGAGEHRDFVPRIDCKESGSTARFLMPVVLAVAGAGRFTGSKGLAKRPFDVYFDIFKLHGIKYTQNLPGFDLKLAGRFKGGNFTLPGNVSSQFITGLLFALPLCRGNSEITLTTPLQSAGYVDMTLDILADFSIEIKNINYQVFKIKGGQAYKTPEKYFVEGDFSAAANYFVADALGCDIKIKGLNINSKQPDREVLNILAHMGCEIVGEKGLLSVKPTELKAVEFSGENCPDILPVLSLALCFGKGRGKITNCQRLKIKECDRLTGTARLIKSLGGNINCDESTIYTSYTESLTRGDLTVYGDHRMRMLAAMCSTVAKGKISIDNTECVAKSYPNFWADFKSLGGKINGC